MIKALRMSALALLGVMLLAVRTDAQTVTISNMWSIATTEGRVYVVNTGETERGVAYHPTNNHAYIVSRNSALRVAIVDGDTGADVGALNVTGITGGTFALSQIGVADDGSIYAANLTTVSATSPFKIYRWASEGAAPVVVYTGNPSGGPSIRYGDAIDVRGGGTNTQIIASTGGANATNLVAVFAPTDDTLATFTAMSILVSGVGLADFAKGVGFGPTNTFYGKNTGNGNLRFCRFDLATGTGSLLASYSVNSAISAVNADPVNNLLAGVATPNAASPHSMFVYDVSGATAVQIASMAFPPPATANVNAAGGIDFYGGRIVGVDARNGVLMVGVSVDNSPTPPNISGQPANQTVVQGGFISFTVGATGTKPLNYQWFYNDDLIENATNSILLRSNIPLTAAGMYQARVSNVAGTANSDSATLTVNPATLSLVLTQCWALPAGNTNFPFLTADNTQRGLSYNATYNHLLVVSRAPSNAIHVLDATTGAYLHSLDLSGISGGTFPINMIACSEDGQVVVANLTVNASTDPFKVYVFPDSLGGNTSLLGWSGNPGDAGLGDTNRWGDNLDVRGSGLGLEVLVGSRNSRRIAIINGLFLALPPIVIDVPDAEAGNFGLCICWGAGDTCWGKSSGTALRHVALDVNSHLGTVLRTITNYPTMTVITVDSANQLLAGISLETPDALRLLNISPALSTPFELDTEFFLSDNANANGTGQIVFGSGKLFALDSNNGIIALGVWPRLRHSVTGSMLTLTWDGTHTLQATPELGVAFTNVVGAVSGHTVDTATTGNLFYRLKD